MGKRNLRASAGAAPAESNAVTTTTADDDAHNARLDQELLLVRNMCSAMTSLLRILLCAKDDLVLLGDHMGRVRMASESFRRELMTRQGSNTDNSTGPANSAPQRTQRIEQIAKKRKQDHR